MKAQLRLFFCVVLISLPLSLRAADSANSFSFADPIVHIPSATQAGSGQITLRSSADQAAAPNLRDVDLPHPLAATVKFDLIKDSDAAKNSWRFVVTVTGLSPANTMQQRYAVVETADKKTQTIPYFLTNQPLVSFVWTISKPPDPWVHSDWLPGAGCTAFTVTPKDSPASGLTITTANLVEQVTKQAITVRDLHLCRSEPCSDTDPIDLPANLPAKLLLRTTRSFHGNFHGSVVLASLQKPDGETILQNLDASSFALKLVGVLLIGVGICLAWWAKVWAHARLERDQALVPAVVMRIQLQALQEVLHQLRQPYRAAATNLNQSITTILGGLDDATLDQLRFLPPKFPNPYGYAVDVAGYKAYLEARNPRIQLFSGLIRQGIMPAEAEDNGLLSPAQQSQVLAAITNIDHICLNVPQPTADQALALVQPILLNLHNTLFPPPVGAPAGAPPPPLSPPENEYEMLSLEMQSVSKGVWLLYGVITALSGLVVLILNNPGFGVPVDLVFALFWGFGLPTTVAALAPGSAATALNIPIAKG